MQIHWQIVMFLHRFLNSENVRKDLSLVVRCASRENVAVLQNRLERRRIPQLQGIGRLHVIMSVDQNCAASGLMFVARPNNRMPTRWDELRLQADAREFFHQPPCALLQLLLILIVGRDTRKPQERIIFGKIIVAHGWKAYSNFWGAHAAHVLVSRPLCKTAEREYEAKSSRSRGRDRSDPNWH